MRLIDTEGIATTAKQHTRLAVAKPEFFNTDAKHHRMSFKKHQRKCWVGLAGANQM